MEDGSDTNSNGMWEVDNRMKIGNKVSMATNIGISH